MPSKGVLIRGRRALIGSTGFLGRTLLYQSDPWGYITDRYHSRNIDEMEGEFEEVIIAAPDARKWHVNQFPHQDVASMHKIIDAIENVEVRRVVLLSTIDAGRPDAGAYGEHRKYLECALRDGHVAILRLPALFGPGLKKNALWDLLNDREVVNRNYQWYDVRNLWKDIKAAQPGRTTTLYSEPLSMWEIAERLMRTPQISMDAVCDYNEPGPYTQTSTEVLDEIVRWARGVV